MSTKKHTHVAVHTIQSQDAKNGTVEIKAGSPFTPESEEQQKALEKSGAIRKAKKEDLEAAKASEAAGDSNAPAGYADGTASAAEEPGLTGNENREGAEPSTTTGARTPATGARGTGGTRGNT